ncbi:MAG TPA: hypothetical protein PLD23_16795 [Armatimonadota bacterium]|nr:hypothetical protein [Armatimonadota bacterium]
MLGAWYAATMLTGLPIVLAGAPEPPVLLATGFEQGLEGWSTQGEAEFAASDDQPHSGARCARIAVAKGVTPAYQQLTHPIADVLPGDQLRAEAWVRAQGVSTAPGAYMALQFVDAGGQRLAIAHSATGANNGKAGWEQLQAEGTAPDGTVSARLDLILHDNATAWFDDVRVVRLARLEPWPDLGTAVRHITVHSEDPISPRFGGVGFHAFDHIFTFTPEQRDNIVRKRWREMNPSFVRLNDSPDWGRAMMDHVAETMLWMKSTGTEIYLTTWDPPRVATDAERAAYAKHMVDYMEYLVRGKGLTNIRTYCMTNELTLGSWGSLAQDLPTFRAYHQALYDELKARGLDIQLLATDASPFEYWSTLEWAAAHMDDITGIYGGHHYINDRPLQDLRFYPWFESKVKWGVDLARSKGKDFILGEFGCKQDGRTLDGKRADRCVYFETPEEPLVGIQLAEAVIAAINAGVYAMGNWTYMDFPDDYRPDYLNKWGTFRWSGDDFSTRAHYYAYGLLTKFLRGPSTILRTEVDDPHVRVAAIEHHGAGTRTIAIVNRYGGDVPVSIAMGDAANGHTFRKYVYDPEHVPRNRFGDLQRPETTVTVRRGTLDDQIGRGTLTVYTTAYDDEPPAAVTGLRIETHTDGSTWAAWDENPAPDLCYYRIFRGDEQIGSTVACRFRVAAGDTADGLRIVAVDQSGNPGV